MVKSCCSASPADGHCRRSTPCSETADQASATQAGLAIRSAADPRPVRQHIPGSSIFRITMPVNDLPLAVLPPEDGGDPKRVLLRLPPVAGRDRVFDRDHVAEVAAGPGGEDLVLTGLAAGETRGQPLEGWANLVPAATGQLGTEQGDRLVRRPQRQPRRDVPVLQADDVVVEQRNDGGREVVDIVHRGLLAVAERSIVALPPSEPQVRTPIPVTSMNSISRSSKVGTDNCRS